MIWALSLLFTKQGPMPDLQLSAPISTWDEALPLGNGEVGALIWGGQHHLNISLDRGDLWDLRHAPETSEAGFTYANLQKLVAKKDTDEIARLFDKPYDRPTPTKLPGLRLEIELAPTADIEHFDLSFHNGLGQAITSNGLVQFVFDRNEPVLVGQTTAKVAQFHFVPPTVLKQLGYPAAETGIDKKTGDSWIQQSNTQGLTYCACIASHTKNGLTTFAVSFVTNAHEVNALKRAHQLADRAASIGFPRKLNESQSWWKDFWNVSSVHVPDETIQKQYDLAMYLYGSGARRGQPPIPLQGLWTADDGGLPPWKGDFHHDLNTQLIYWPYLESGHFEQGLGLLDFLWKQLPMYRRYAEEFFGTSGAAIPGVAALDGSPLAGWGMYSNSITMGPWLSIAFVDHWRTTRDANFLRTRAYPFCKELAQCVEVQLRSDGRGRLVLPLSSSPEIHDNSLAAFIKPNSNFDLSVLKAFFLGLKEMAIALKKPDEAKRYGDLANQLGDFWSDESGLKVSQDEDLTESHRHFSHLVAIHPFGLVNVDGSEATKKLINDSFAHLKTLGTSEWCGYSFSWIACMEARCGLADEALKALSIYANAFVLRNGFHANGDQSGKGYSNFRYRPFTLEGNFAAAQAVHEMLMQSWGDTIRLFPATPWPSCSFENLRAEGGFIVSATRQDNHLTSARIKATVTGKLNLKTDTPLHWQTPTGPLTTDHLSILLKPGETVQLIP